MTKEESKKILDDVWKDYQQREQTKRTAKADITKKKLAWIISPQTERNPASR